MKSLLFKTTGTVIWIMYCTVEVQFKQNAFRVLFWQRECK